MSQSGALVVEDLHMTYKAASGLVQAVRGVSFTVQPGEFYTLLGASGCGKTTVLRCIAGLEAPERGRIAIGNTVVYSDVDHIADPPYRRDIGMVFQSYAIWPHLTVFDNVAFPLVSGRHRFNRQQVQERTRRALRLVQLDDLASRPAPLLSGGQQQRVALARALVAEPAVLLLDEPLSNLDARLRADMRFEITSLVKSLGVTTLYVTHDQMEALTMSDRVAVMQDGVFVEEAAPRDIYLRPRAAFTAAFLGDTNLIAGTVSERAARDDMWRVDTSHGPFICPAGDWLDGPDSVWIACRPEGVLLTATIPQGENILTGRIIAATFAGTRLPTVWPLASKCCRPRVPLSAVFMPATRCSYSYHPSAVCSCVAQIALVFSTAHRRYVAGSICRRMRLVPRTYPAKLAGLLAVRSTRVDWL